MEKKIKAGALGILCTAALLLSGYTMNAVLIQPAEAMQPSQMIYAAVEEPPGKYIIRSYNGKIALFTVGATNLLIAETDIDVSTLRAYDRQLLEDGIEVGTYEDVLRLLEDFGS